MCIASFGGQDACMSQAIMQTSLYALYGPRSRKEKLAVWEQYL